MKNPLAAACLAVLLALGACASEPSGYHVQPKNPLEPEVIASREQQQPAEPRYAAAYQPPAPSYQPAPAPQPVYVERTVDTVKLHVEGMTCPVRCPREIKEMLAVVPGVINVAVDVPSQTVLVNVPHGMNTQSLVDAIKSPYRARLM